MKTKTRLQVSQNAAFRREVAEKIVSEAHPGYHSGGFHYTDPVEGKVYFKETQAPWNPWSDETSPRIVGVQALVDPSGICDFSPVVDWNIPDIPYRDMVEAYLESQEEEFEANGDIPNWVSRGEVIAFASKDDRWKDLIEEIEDASHEAAVSFAEGEILDEIEIDEEFSY